MQKSSEIIENKVNMKNQSCFYTSDECLEIELFLNAIYSGSFQKKDIGVNL